MNAKLIITIGLGVVLIGMVLMFFPNAFKWFGNLPGDIKSDSGNTRIYFPIVSMLLISVVVSMVRYLMRYLGS